MSSATYTRRKAQGLCPMCGALRSEPFVYCGRCREDYRIAHRDAYDASLPFADALQLQAYRARLITLIPVMHTPAPALSFWRFDLPGSAILCCGQWHAISSIPL